MAWTTQSATEFMKRQLGFPARKVELDHTSFEYALKKAIDKYMQAKPSFGYERITVGAGTSGYNLKEMNKAFGRGLTRLFIEPITKPQAVFSEFEYYRLRQPPYVDMGELVIDQMYYKEIGLLTGTWPDWEWIQEATMLLFTPVPTRSFNAAYEYNRDPATIAEVPIVGQTWVLDYATAIATKMLGRVRGKFQGVAGNDLPVTTDFSELLSESSSEMKELEDDLWKARGAWTPPIKG